MQKYPLLNGDHISEDEIKKIFKWCKKNIGKSKYFSIQKFKIKTDIKLKQFLGLFYVSKDRTNICIHVNPLTHIDKIDVIATIIHEYVHFTQDPDEYTNLDFWLPRDSMYYDHPHEKEAEDIAQKLKKKCYKELGL